MMRGLAYTPCRLYYEGLRALNVGDYLVTPGGSAYLITSIRPSRTRPHRKHLECLRWPLAELPDRARTHPLYWYRRERRGRRSLASLHATRAPA